MKKIGLVGGISPASTVTYYTALNAAAKARYGGDTSADILIRSANFDQFVKLYKAGDWTGYKAKIVDVASDLEAAGCDLLAIASNASNMAAKDLAAAIPVPVVSMIDALGAALKTAGVKRPLLLGTRFVMEGDFYRPELKAGFNLDCLIPDADGRDTIEDVIFTELAKNVVTEKSRGRYLEVIEKGREAGADGIILGCTEIGLLISSDHTDAPLFDTTYIHCAAIAKAAFT